MLFSGKKLPDLMRAKMSDGQRFLVLCVATGLLCGLAAVAFHLSIQWLFYHVLSLAEWFRGQSGMEREWAFATVLGGAPVVGGLLVGLVLKIAPAAAGSGIPQTKAAYYNNFGIIRLRDGGYRFVLGVISVGTGISLGREGPTVHFCAALASRLGRWAFRAPARIQAMVPVGMGAGIAAAFNSPISAIMFVFEELLDDFSTKALGGIVIAVVLAAAVERTLLGEDPVLPVQMADNFVTHPWMLVALPLGLAAGLLGHLFVAGLLGMRAKFRHWKAPVWLKPALGGLGTGVAGLAVYYFSRHAGPAQTGVFSIGYDSLVGAFTGHYGWTILLALFIGKFIATQVAYGSGGSGGLFSPTLFLGGMLGGLFGALITHLGTISPWLKVENPEHVAGACVLLGMGALFASVVRCPLTSIIMIFEMTRNYSLMLPLMAGNMLSYYLARRLHRVSLYNALILQDGITLKRMPTYQGAQDYQNLPVAAIMTHEVVSLDGNQTAQQNLDSLATTGQRFHAYPVLIDDIFRAVILHRELMAAAAGPSDTPLATLLSGHKSTVIMPDTSIREAAHLMIAKSYGQLPVCGAHDPGKLLGWITLHDIARQQNAVETGMGR